MQNSLLGRSMPTAMTYMMGCHGGGSGQRSTTTRRSSARAPGSSRGASAARRRSARTTLTSCYEPYDVIFREPSDCFSSVAVENLGATRAHVGKEHSLYHKGWVPVPVFVNVLAMTFGEAFGLPHTPSPISELVSAGAVSAGLLRRVRNVLLPLESHSAGAAHRQTSHQDAFRPRDFACRQS